jgi:hypothetical protein
LLVDLAWYKKQIVDSFEKKRGLYVGGLNSKEILDIACILQEAIEKVWGNCTSYETTNPTLDLRRQGGRCWSCTQKIMERTKSPKTSLWSELSRNILWSKWGGMWTGQP